MLELTYIGTDSFVSLSGTFRNSRRLGRMGEFGMALQLGQKELS